MNDRERILSIVVGGLLACTVVWLGFANYRDAVRSRHQVIAQLHQEQQRLSEQELQGAYADRQMGEYTVRSLPGNLERAQSHYQQWLLGIVQASDLSATTVEPTSSRPVDGLYQQLGFRVLGKTNFPNLIGLLHAFYAKDYLHRIRDLSVRPTKTGDFTVELMIEAIAILKAPVELPEPNQSSWRIEGGLASYRTPILNRNLFEPPNQPPKYDGRAEIEVIVGRQTPTPLDFTDPEGNQIRYELLETPHGVVNLDQETGDLQILSEKKQEFEILVRATDNGYPQRSIEQTLTIHVVEPPPPPTPEPPKLKFDDATQTVLTALVQGREEWTAWMHVRTRDKTVRLRVGDEFEIGSMKGKVVEVTARHVTLESNGLRFTLKPAGNLSEAAKQAHEN